jgi:hypothetical protein
MRKSSRLSLEADRRRLESLWKQHVADIERWRRTFRPHLLRLFAERSATLAWSRTLLTLVLDELRTEDAFRELVGDPRHVPTRRYPQAIAVAIALRHSWRPDELTRLAKRLGIALSANPLSAEPLVASSTLPQASAARSPNNRRGRKPGHHVRNSGARLRPVKALRFAPTPCGASGLDRDVGRARRRHLRDDPADHPRDSRSSRS